MAAAGSDDPARSGYAALQPDGLAKVRDGSDAERIDTVKIVSGLIFTQRVLGLVRVPDAAIIVNGAGLGRQARDFLIGRGGLDR